MTRWLIAFATVLLLGAALWPIKEYRGDLSGADEILAYELSTPRGVNVLVPGGTEEIVLKSWLVVPKQQTRGPLEQYSYDLHASIVIASGHKLMERRFEIGSRISTNPSEALASGRFAARLAESDEWVTDGRTTRINVSELGSRAASMRVWAPQTPGSLVLVRLTYEEPRGDVERALLERTLLPEQRRRVVGNSAALGFPDLPNVARERVLSTWGRRLTAEGRSGLDFSVRRLLIGNYRAEAESEETPEGFDVGPYQHAVFNLRGPAGLEVDGSPGTVVLLQEGDASPVKHTIGSGGRVRFTLGLEGPRSAALWTETPSRLRFWLPQGALAQLLGRPNVTESGGQFEVSPDHRYQRYWRLDPRSALRFEIAEGQALFGVVLRAAAEPGARDARVAATVTWEGSSDPDMTSTFQATLPVARVDSAEGIALSETGRSVLIPPGEATAMLLTGPASTVVSVWTPEPFVSDSVPDPSYPLELGEGIAWRATPSGMRSTATLIPERSSELAKANRSLSVRVQPRIAGVSRGSGRLATETVLAPSGASTARRVLRKVWHPSGGAFPDNGWLLMSDGVETAIVVSGEPDTTVPVALLYRTCTDRAGRSLRVSLDGKRVLERRITATTGSHTIRARSGPHTLTVDGTSECGSVLVGAAPAAGGPIFKRQVVHQLARGRPLRFPFTVDPNRQMSISLVVVSEGKRSPYALPYSIALGAAGLRKGVFLRRATKLEGTIAGDTGERERPHLWETGSRLTARGGDDFLGNAPITLGDDLSAGAHELVLRSTSSAPLWVRAILIGRAMDAPED